MGETFCGLFFAGRDEKLSQILQKYIRNNRHETRAGRGFTFWTFWQCSRSWRQMIAFSIEGA
jgi:hypothetical protein